jgi:hypothetical protein
MVGAGLVVSLVLFASPSSRAFPPPHRRHTFEGVLSPDPGSGRPARITLRMDCILYSAVFAGDDFCTGRYACQGAGCPAAAGSAELLLLDVASEDPRTDPRRPAELYLRSDRGPCTVVGSVAYRLTSVIPAFSGRYECAGTDGSALDAGLLGIRATTVGASHTNVR